MKQSRKTRLYREIAINLCLMAAGFLFMFLVLEAAVRVLDLSDYFPMQYDECAGLKYRPNSVGTYREPEFHTNPRFNKDGYHDYDHNLTKDEDTYRILVLGDSFMESSRVQREDSLQVYLDEAFRNLTSQRVEVMSMAVSGYGTDQEYLTLKCYGAAYKPDLVVIGFLTANDVSDNKESLNGYPCKPYFILDNGSLRLDDSFKSECTGLKQRAIRWVGHHSRFAYFAYASLIKLTSKAAPGVPSELDVYAINYTDDYREAWEVTKGIMLAARNYTQSNGMDLLIVSLSNPHQLKWNETLALYPQLSDGYDPDKPYQLIEGFCAGEDFRCLHLLSVMREYKQSSGRDPHYAIDGHWNEEGNRLAAYTIAGHIVDHFLAT